MSALAKIQAAGFEIWLKNNGNIGVRPFDALTAEQIAYLKEHKSEIVEALAANDAEAAPATELKTNPIITCKNCTHFESHHVHGGGSGACRAEVVPFGACWWADDLHQCDKYQSAAADPLLVEVFTPSGTAMMIRADDAEHAAWLKRMNPKPADPTPKPDLTKFEDSHDE